MSAEVKVWPPPETKHRCQRHLPWDSSGYGSTGYPNGAVAVCSCGRAWYSDACFESYGPTEKWYPVRWYHRRKRAFAAARQEQTNE